MIAYGTAALGTHATTYPANVGQAQTRQWEIVDGGRPT
jgi:hypothetical protein